MTVQVWGLIVEEFRRWGPDPRNRGLIGRSGWTVLARPIRD